MSKENVEVFLHRLLKSESREKRNKKIRTVKSQPISFNMKPLKTHLKCVPKSKKVALKNAAAAEKLNLQQTSSSLPSKSASITPKTNTKDPYRRQSKKLNCRQKRQFKKLTPQDFKNAKYQDFLPLNYLHTQYLTSVLAKFVKNSRSIESIQNEILKMDLHGCLLKVERSKVQNLVGLEGLVILESKFAFKIITKADKVVTVNKKVCVFKVNFQLPNDVNDENSGHSKYAATIYGENFCLAPGMRILKKFKNCPDISMF